MDKAKEIWRDKIRRDRVEPLQKLDADYMKALETGSDTASIVAQKQALRDAPALPSIDAATTPEELKAIQPIPDVIIEQIKRRIQNDPTKLAILAQVSRC